MPQALAINFACKNLDNLTLYYLVLLVCQKYKTTVLSV